MRVMISSIMSTIASLENPTQTAILSAEAQAFLTKLSAKFEPRRQQLLARRKEVQQKLDSGWTPDFLTETADVRKGDWKVAPIPKDLLDRRVEITGPVDRKMIINALNSGANVFMADFEDSNSPTWNNNLDGQQNLYDAIRGTIEYVSPEGKRYELGSKLATLVVRPRGWHLDEKHFLVDGKPISGSLFDFGLFFFHNAKELLNRGTGPYFYLPKLESHLEARLWNEVFCFAQDELGIPRGSIRATVLIETILAAFEMDEILYELREHSAGLNCGRWDYIFSFIKKFRARPDFVLPDRSLVTMERHFLVPTSNCSFKPATGAAFMPWAEWRPRFRSAMTRPLTSRRSKKFAATNCAKCKPDTMAPGLPTPAWFPLPRKSSTSTCPSQIRLRSRARIAPSPRRIY